MPTFTPPTTAGIPTFNRSKSDVANRHWMFFGSWDMGQTVWKDQLGTWHQQIYPYQGGDSHTTHDTVTNTTTTTVDDSVMSLANAQVVYHGGHVYDITEDEATELINAGFGAGIEDVFIDGGSPLVGAADSIDSGSVSSPPGDHTDGGHI